MILLLCGCVSALQDQPSLAERAEALRKKAESEATPTATPTATPAPTPASTATPTSVTPASVTPTPTTAPTPAPRATPKSATTPRATPTPAPAARSTPHSTPHISNDAGRNDYRNDDLGLEIKCLDGWSLVDLGELAARKAVSPAKFRVQNGAEITRDARNVYALRDVAGSGVVLTLVQFQPDDPLPLNLRSDIQRAIAQEDPGMRLTEEALPLDDSIHHFAAFRAFDLHGSRFESVQAMVFRGHLVQFVVASSSQERVSTILKDLKTRIHWSGTQ